MNDIQKTDIVMQPTERRLGAKDSATRTKLIKAGIEIIQNEGSLAFTARRVAEKAGLKQQLVYYYFRTMEDLLLAIIEFAGNEGLKRAARAVASKEPLRELWKVAMAERSAVLVSEVKTLAQNSEVVQQAMVRQLEQYRILTTEAIERHLKDRGSPMSSSAMNIVMICDALTLLLASENAVGFSLGHEQLVKAIEGWLDAQYRTGG